MLNLLRTIVRSAPRYTPHFVKSFIHNNRLLDNLSRKTFSSLVTLGTDSLTIEDGPMKGLKLAASEHVSHAHISGIYELDTQRAIDPLVKPGAVCYDLGASIGYLSLLMARKARKVYSFEPAPHAAEEIRRHAAANQFANIEVVPLPVSDSPREVEFSLTDVAYGSCIVEGDTKWPTIKLTCTTLDDFVRTNEPPDFIKIDVENQEGRVMEGARGLLSARRTVICCELHSVEAARQVLGILAEYGYRVTDLDGAPFAPIGEVIPGEVQVLAYPS